MAARSDSQIAFFQTADADSKSYAIQCASGTTAYADFTPGYYDCWAPAGAVGEHFRWKYLDMPDPASPPTIAAGSIVAPAAGTSSQTAQTAHSMAPANAMIRLYVNGAKRIAILSSVAGPITLYCTKVL